MIFFCDYWFSRFFLKTIIINISHIQKNAQKHRNICIFSHYDENNIIHPYVIYYLDRIVKTGCDIIFVTTSESIAQNELAKVNSYCIKTIIKNNQGRDFPSFKVGIEHVDLNKYEKLILANDSVYGPFDDLDPLIAFGDTHLDAWSATDSMEKKYHLQSYFLVFPKQTRENEAFKRFWRELIPLTLKRNIVMHYEIGLSQLLLNENLHIGAYCQYTTIENDIIAANYQSNHYLKHVMGEWHTRFDFLFKNNRLELQYENEKLKQIFKKYVNPTHFFWKELITCYKHIFLKKDLIASDIINLSNVEIVLKNRNYNFSYIQNHYNHIRAIPANPTLTGSL